MPRRLLSVAALCCATLAVRSDAEVTIAVYPTIAPNVYGSTAFDTWFQNATTALDLGTLASGAIGTPSYYSVAPSTIPAADVIVTRFSSWRGLADPASIPELGLDFAGEHGNRLAFSVLVDGGGEKLSISQLSFTLSALGSNFAYSYTNPSGTYTYGNYWIGVLYGADGQLGGGDDTFVRSGESSVLVDALIGRGSGIGWEPDATTGTDQEKINALAAELASIAPIYVTGTYSMLLANGTTISSSALTVIVPEPATCAALCGGAALAFVGWRRRTKRQIA